LLYLRNFLWLEGFDLWDGIETGSGQRLKAFVSIIFPFPLGSLLACEEMHEYALHFALALFCEPRLEKSGNTALRSMLLSDSLAGWFCNLERLGGWGRGRTGVEAGAGSNFPHTSWSPTVSAWIGKSRRVVGMDVLYKYLILWIGQPASVVQTHFKKHLVSLCRDVLFSFLYVTPARTLISTKWCLFFTCFHCYGLSRASNESMVDSFKSS